MSTSTFATSETPVNRIPTTQVRSSINRQRRPSTILIDIPLVGVGSTRDEAFESFQNDIKNFRDLIDSLGDKVVNFQLGGPRESERETERAFRTVTTHTVSTTGTIAVTTSSDLGDVLAELLRREILFTTPRFEYPTTGEISPDEYETVCRRAREIAEAAARGSGCGIGRVLKIEFPSTRSHGEVIRPFRDTEFFSEISRGLPMFTDYNYLQTADPSLLGMLNTDVPTYDDEFVVDITFELT